VGDCIAYHDVRWAVAGLVSRNAKAFVKPNLSGPLGNFFMQLREQTSKADVLFTHHLEVLLLDGEVTQCVFLVLAPFAVGSVIFGHVGDTYGRRVTMMASILAVSVPTVLIGRLICSEDRGQAANCTSCAFPTASNPVTCYYA
jgi:MFS family permease